MDLRSAPSNPDIVIGEPLPIVKPDPQRLVANLRAINEIGSDPAGGVTRLAFTPQERQSHDLAAEWLRDLGFEVRVDAVGNTIGRRQGSRTGTHAIALGSHLDTVPCGGGFDGTVGVVGAVEVVRMLDTAGLGVGEPTNGGDLCRRRGRPLRGALYRQQGGGWHVDGAEAAAPPG